MAHKTIQLYRNSTICRPNTSTGKTALTIAKERLETYGSRNDGEITLMRYQEGNNDPVKTIAAIYHANGNSGTWTYLIEFTPDDYYTKDETDSIIDRVETTIEDNEQVIASALTDLDYRKQDVIDDLGTIRSGAAAGASIPSHVRNITQSDISSWDEKMQRVPITMSNSNGTLSFWENGTSLTHSEVKSLLSDQSKYIELKYNDVIYHGVYSTSTSTWTGTSLIEEVYYQISLDCSGSAIAIDEASDLTYLSENNYLSYAVPLARTVNNKALSSNITLNANDIPITVITNSTNGNVTQALDSGKFYNLTGSLTSLSLTLNTTTGLAVYAGKFTAHSDGCTLSVPASVSIASNTPSIDGGETYEFSILDNVLMMVKL